MFAFLRLLFLADLKSAIPFTLYLLYFMLKIWMKDFLDD